MTAVPSRRAFLRGRFKAPPVMRPYGAQEESVFQELCTTCGDCIDACEEAILIKDDGGYPVVSLAQNGCTFCGDCISACEPGALVQDQIWPWAVKISENCLSEKGVHCRACQDHCDERVIRFRPALGGRSTMQLDASLCTGCGFCVAPCPVNAISLTQKSSQPTEASNA